MSFQNDALFIVSSKSEQVVKVINYALKIDLGAHHDGIWVSLFSRVGFVARVGEGERVGVADKMVVTKRNRVSVMTDVILKIDREKGKGTQGGGTAWALP